MQKKVDAYFAATKKPHSTGGVVIVMHGGDRVFEGSYGAANREWDIPWTTDTQFWTASVAKSYAAQIVLRLSDAGLVNLNAPVRDYIPEFPDYETPVRVWHLLSMRSGLNEDSDSQFISGNGLGGYGNPGMTKDEILRFIYSQPAPIFTPGRAKAHYENVAYSVLDRLIENVTGTHYKEAVKKYITDPWGLKATGAYEWNHFWALGDKAATAYISADGQKIPNIETEMPFTFLHAGGIMYFTANDFAEWAKHSAYGVNGEKPMFERMAKPEQLEGLGDTDYGFGIYRTSHRGHDVFGHTGYVGTYYSWVPSLDLLTVFMTNEIDGFSRLDAPRIILDSSMSILGIGPQNTQHAERVLPGDPTPSQLKISQRRFGSDIKGVFVNNDTGHVMASVETNEGFIRHSLNGQNFSLLGDTSNDPRLTAIIRLSNTSKIDVSVEQSGLQIKGWGFERPHLFTRVDPQPANAETKRAVLGVFYNSAWGSKFEIINENDVLTLWTGDRSAAGKRPLSRIADRQWIAGSLTDGDFWSVRFQKGGNGAFDRFVLHTPTTRGSVFNRVVPIDE
ncbi:MAG: serine hydrolase domain-containing protein [Pseudomonadota bacterium]